MGTKFSEDVIPLSDLKINPGKVLSQVTETHRPVLVTSRGRGVAVVQALKDYEETKENDPTETILADPDFSASFLQTMERVQTGKVRWQSYDEVFR
ncbi:MAG: type II toxin-antitoxin system Phd/YefM family antitoxin [Nitrospirales bacterium]|nr:type II toxin-antitoxin system Phd/YefM family antitoxin [Nitrospirales bacterium]